MEGVNQESSASGYILKINSTIFEKKAVLNTSYLFTHRVYINIDELNNNVISIEFSKKIEGENLNTIAKEFCNELIDQQVRLNCEKDFGHIREMIVEEAFKPVSKENKIDE